MPLLLTTAVYTGKLIHKGADERIRETSRFWQVPNHKQGDDWEEMPSIDYIEESENKMHKRN